MHADLRARDLGDRVAQPEQVGRVVIAHERPRSILRHGGIDRAARIGPQLLHKARGRDAPAAHRHGGDGKAHTVRAVRAAQIHQARTRLTGTLGREPAVSELAAELGLTPVPWCTDGFYYDAAARPGLSPLHEAGCYYLQEPSAMAPAELLDPQPGERVLDLCAAPGGKSTQLAGKLQGRGLLVCNEISAKRAKILAGNIERLGIANALVLNEHPKKLEARFEGYFDKILVDAPCSGEGMFRKEEAAVTDWTEDTNAICATTSPSSQSLFHSFQTMFLSIMF